MQGDHFGLLSWNIYKARDKAWAEDFGRLSESRDLILLQEAHLTPGFMALLAKRDYRWSMVRAFDFNGAEAGVLTASKVPPTQGCLLRTAEPLLRVPKSVLITRYGVADAPADLLVANLHGVNFSLGTEPFRRQLEAVAWVLADHSGPAILAGDFNTWSRSRREILREVTRRLGLLDLPLAQDRRSRVWGQALDHVFYRGLDVVTAESLEVSSSDHNPLRVTFRFKHTALGANP
jgi:endonuclease/exonuclease/phosphatase (EEP) superfamily protein YafD